MNKEQEIQMKLAQLEYIQEQIHSFFELFCDFVDEFDMSEYQQGKKDGMENCVIFYSRSFMGRFKVVGRQVTGTRTNTRRKGKIKCTKIL